MASGLFAYLDDATATKPIHAGWAAHAGILASRLAAAGAQGPPRVLEGRFGVFDAFLGPDLGTRTLYHGHSYSGNALAAAVSSIR